MADPEIRGSWTIHQGVMTRWSEAQLNDYLRSLDQWAAASAETRARFLPLNETEQRPETPFPFVVFEIGEGRRVSGDSGLASDQHGITWVYPLTFTVHARTKSVAQQVAKRIAQHFTDRLLCVEPDGWVATDPVGDFSFREGDENWAWRLIYDIRVTAAYKTTPG